MYNIFAFACSLLPEHVLSYHKQPWQGQARGSGPAKHSVGRWQPGSLYPGSAGVIKRRQPSEMYVVLETKQDRTDRAEFLAVVPELVEGCCKCLIRAPFYPTLAYEHLDC